MDEPDYDVKKEEILSRLDYAIASLKPLNDNWDELIILLSKIEQLVKEY